MLYEDRLIYLYTGLVPVWFLFGSGVVPVWFQLGSFWFRFGSSRRPLISLPSASHKPLIRLSYAYMPLISLP